MPKGIPLSAAAGTVVLGIIGVGAIAAAGIVGRTVGGSDTVPLGMLLVTLGTLIVYGLLAIAAAVGTWLGAGWGWAAGLAVFVVGVLAAASAGLAGALDPALLEAPALYWLVTGVVLFVLLAITLAAPSVRTRAGIGGNGS